MVVGLALAAVQMGMALPTGFLFGVGYGTGVRVGYEQVYPLLFPKGARPTTTELAATMKGMNTVYDAIGGKDASRMGIAVGIINAGEILNNPDFRVLEQLELSSSGPTSSNSNRLVSGRGSLDLSDSSSDEILLEEIEEFNKLTNAEMWTKIRAMSTGQILNSRTGTGQSAEWMEITGKVLAERAQSGFTSSSITTDVDPLTQAQKEAQILKQQAAAEPAKQPVALEWITKRDNLLIAIGDLKRKIANYDSSLSRGKLTFVDVKVDYNKTKQRLLDHKKELRVLSNDYRHPNNFIRTQALILRKLMQTL